MLITAINSIYRSQKHNLGQINRFGSRGLFKDLLKQEEAEIEKARKKGLKPAEVSISIRQSAQEDDRQTAQENRWVAGLPVDYRMGSGFNKDNLMSFAHEAILSKTIDGRKKILTGKKFLNYFVTPLGVSRLNIANGVGIMNNECHATRESAAERFHLYGQTADRVLKQIEADFGKMSPSDIRLLQETLEAAYNRGLIYNFEKEYWGVPIEVRQHLETFYEDDAIEEPCAYAVDSVETDSEPFRHEEYLEELNQFKAQLSSFSDLNNPANPVPDSYKDDVADTAKRFIRALEMPSLPEVIAEHATSHPKDSLDTRETFVYQLGTSLRTLGDYLGELAIEEPGNPKFQELSVLATHLHRQGVTGKLFSE